MRSGKRKKKRPFIIRFFGFIFKTLLWLTLVAVIAGVGFVGYITLTSDPINSASVYARIDQSSYVYDKDGELIETLHFDEDRKIVPSDEIPNVTKQAFVAIEDKTFYSHHGFNFKRMVGAILNKLLGRSSEISGTSTITQQLARNVFLADIKSERTLSRKLKEMLYAVQLEKEMSKDEILEAYLNTIYLGYGCYGIDAAAQTYFSKDVSELNLEESAALAALPQAPDTYALLKDEEGEDTVEIYTDDDRLVYANDISKDRRDLTLDLMVKQGYITQEEADEAKVDIADILKPSFKTESEGYSYFTDYLAETVAEDLSKEYGMSKEAALKKVYAGGLSIYSTLDSQIQTIVCDEFENDYNFPWSEEEPQAAMVIMDVKTGKVLAMQGGRNTEGKQLFNRATNPRQPGSSIKPLSVYSAALQKSYECVKNGEEFVYTDYGYDKQGIRDWGDYITVSSKVVDEKMYIDGKLWPQNFSKTYSGNQTFRTALQQSLNTCAVKIQLQVGADYSAEMLKKYGISTCQFDTTEPVNDLNPAALALGAMTYGVTPLDMASAYATFPNGGMRNSPVCYTEVKNSDGQTLLYGEPEETRVLDEGVAYIMTDVLKTVVSKGIAGNAGIRGIQVGGKTGTTNDSYDFWFCGFTPKYSAALWIGTDQNTEMSGTSSQAASMWSRIMRQIPDITSGEYKDMPYNVIEKYGEYYTEGTEPGYYTGFRNTGSGRSSNSSSGSGSSSRSSTGDSEWSKPE